MVQVFHTHQEMERRITLKLMAEMLLTTTYSHICLFIYGVEQIKQFFSICWLKCREALNQ